MWRPRPTCDAEAGGCRPVRRICRAVTVKFFDFAIIHVLTTATIDRLRELYPEGRFEVRRFRPNIVVEPASGERTFVENSWIGRTLTLGDEIRLKHQRSLPSVGGETL